MHRYAIPRPYVEGYHGMSTSGLSRKIHWNEARLEESGTRTFSVASASSESELSAWHRLYHAVNSMYACISTYQNLVDYYQEKTPAPRDTVGVNVNEGTASDIPGSSG